MKMHGNKEMQFQKDFPKYLHLSCLVHGTRIRVSGMKGLRCKIEGGTSFQFYASFDSVVA